MMILAGDIGGTKTNLGIFSAEKGAHEPLEEATFPSQSYPSLEAIVREFRHQSGHEIASATFGVSGPVVGGRSRITNLPWIMDERQMEEDLGVPSVRLLNDLEAIANAVPVLEAEDVHTLHHGQPEPGGVIAVIAPGTGLGEAYLTWDGNRYQAHASEGGHTDFAPVNQLEIGLLNHLLARFGHVSYERVCSGPGIANIYQYLKASGYADEPAWFGAELAAVSDPTPLITNNALQGKRPCPLCEATLEAFVSIFGTEAGNLALKVLATGGVYLGGGIPPRILPALQKPDFLDRFQDKGRMSPLVERIPVHVILNPKVALLGAASYCLSSACAVEGP